MKSTHTSILGGVLATACLAPTASAAFLDNNDFEQEPLNADATGTTFPGWIENAGAAAVDAPVAIAGNHSAKLVPVSAGNLFQSVNDDTDALSSYIFSFDVAASDPGGGDARSLNLNLRHTTGGFNQINLRLTDNGDDGIGDLEFFGGSWVEPVGLANAFTFSADDLNLSVNHIEIIVSYADAGSSYVVNVTDGNGVLRTSGPLSAFHGNAPTAASALEVVSFETGNSAAGSFSVIDNVTLIPEPASLALAAAGLGLVIRRNRRG